MNLAEYRQAVIDGVMCLYCGANTGVPCRAYSVSHFAHIYLDYVHDNRSVAFHNQMAVFRSHLNTEELAEERDSLTRDLKTLREHAAKARQSLRRSRTALGIIKRSVQRLDDVIWDIPAEPELEYDTRHTNDDDTDSGDFF